MYKAKRYKLESPLIDFLENDDSFFYSNKGIFINRGQYDLCTSNNALSTFNSLVDDVLQIKPFIVFAFPFNQSENTVIIPNEIIHIDSANWITHYSLTSFSSNKQSSERPNDLHFSSFESKQQFIDKVELALKHIATGEVKKIVLARQLLVTSDVDIDKRLLIQELIDSQPESFVYSVKNFVGAHPELLVEKSGQSVKCLPMAGTRKRLVRAGDDDALIADLQTNHKDLAEHQFVVDDIINALSTVSSDGTSSKPYVVRLPNVSHLATSITATLDQDADLLKLVNILHPTPAVAGTPTLNAIKLISEIENFDREIYGGPVGYIDTLGDGQCAIALRCAKVIKNKATLFAGVGIVEESNVEKEFEETQSKFNTIKNALTNIVQ